MHVIHVYSIPKRSERIEIACPSMRVCVRARSREGETGWKTNGEGWTGEGEEATHKYPRAQAYTPTARAGREKDEGGGEGRHGGGIYYSGFTVITRRGRTTPQRQRRCIRHGNVGCVHPIRAVRARTRLSYVYVRVYAQRHTAMHGRGRIVATSRHPCISSPSDLRFVVSPLHACITSRVIERWSCTLFRAVVALTRGVVHTAVTFVPRRDYQVSLSNRHMTR